MDSGFRADDSTRVLLPIHQLYMRGPGAYLDPSFVSTRRSELHERLEPRDFLKVLPLECQPSGGQAGESDAGDQRNNLILPPLSSSHVRGRSKSSGR